MQNSDINMEIATRIRELRELKEVSVEAMAAALDVPVPAYQKMESGSEDISASRLNEIAHQLGVDLALLLTGKESRMSTFTVTRAGQGVTIQRRKEYQYQALAANFSNKRAEPFVVVCPPTPEGAPVPVNSHPGQEIDYVLEGQLKVVVCGNEVVLNPGDTIYYDSGNPHGMVAVGGQPARFIAIIL